MLRLWLESINVKRLTHASEQKASLKEGTGEILHNLYCHQFYGPKDVIFKWSQ